jgi:hypothetical protein
MLPINRDTNTSKILPCTLYLEKIVWLFIGILPQQLGQPAWGLQKFGGVARLGGYDLTGSFYHAASL